MTEIGTYLKVSTQLFLNNYFFIILGASENGAFSYKICIY